MVVKPTIGFLAADSDALLVKDAQTIVTLMTKNASYPTPSPALACVTTCLLYTSDATDE